MTPKEDSQLWDERLACNVVVLLLQLLLLVLVDRTGWELPAVCPTIYFWKRTSTPPVPMMAVFWVCSGRYFRLSDVFLVRYSTITFKWDVHQSCIVFGQFLVVQPYFLKSEAKKIRFRILNLFLKTTSNAQLFVDDDDLKYKYRITRTKMKRKTKQTNNRWIIKK